jgi:signal transduction histidine kinase
MHLSKRFSALLSFQLAQFADRDDLQSVVVYVTEPGNGKGPSLVPIGQWPLSSRILPAVEANSTLRAPAEKRRWLPLRHDNVLLGAIQVETLSVPWPEGLRQRLQAVALCLTEALCLDLEQQQLQQAINQQKAELEVLLHQLRNPLAALRTFGQLLLRRLDQDNRNRPLVEGLLAEERQLNRYIDALSRLGSQATPTVAGEAAQPPLLLPPALIGPEGEPLQEWLEPLLQRSAATAALQGRPWHPPACLPSWRGDSGAVAEILANLLENAFRYSPAGTAIGLHCQPPRHGPWQLTVWDAGEPIAGQERDAIFERGFRGRQGQACPGTGLGLALARDLARNLGGELSLVLPPATIAPELPARGNAFCLRLPTAAPEH